MTKVPEFGAQTTDSGNCYVPNMSHHAHVDVNGEITVRFVDTPVDGSVLLAATMLATAATIKPNIKLIEQYGRILAFTSATAAGVFIVHGKDYLGQYMSEQITCVAGVAAGLKAFKFIDRVVSTTNNGNITITTGAGYGLPFCAVELVREIVDGITSAEGVITAAVVTTPTNITGDVRGTYNPNTAGNGLKDVAVTYVATASLSGGLYGPVQA